MPYKDPDTRRLKAREYSRKFRAEHLERQRDSQRRSYAKCGSKWAKPCRPAAAARIRAWRQRNPDKTRAYWKVKAALKAGKLHKPERCEQCGASAKLEAHHHLGYAGHELDVQWLCRVCHGETKRGLPPKPRRIIHT